VDVILPAQWGSGIWGGTDKSIVCDKSDESEDSTESEGKTSSSEPESNAAVAEVESRDEAVSDHQKNTNLEAIVTAMPQSREGADRVTLTSMSTVNKAQKHKSEKELVGNSVGDCQQSVKHVVSCTSDIHYVSLAESSDDTVVDPSDGGEVAESPRGTDAVVAEPPGRDTRVVLQPADTEEAAKKQRRRKSSMCSCSCNRSRRHRRNRSRSRGMLGFQEGRMHVGLQKDLRPRPAINSAAASRRELPAGPLPALVGQGNFMIATWVVGKGCSMSELGPKLQFAPFDCIVVIMSSAVRTWDQIWMDFMDLVNGGAYENTAVAAVQSEKAVHRLADSAFVVLHRAKIESCVSNVALLCGRGHATRDRVQVVTLHLVMNNMRQRMQQINIGFLNVNGSLCDVEKRALVQWVVADRIAILTGWFGDNDSELVETLGRDAGAIGRMPFYQGVWWHNNRSRGWECLTCSSYFLLFGLYREMRWPVSCPVVPDDIEVGEDILDDMIPIRDIPEWPDNDEGSVHVPNLGNIKMKEADFSRWCSHTFQTCLWLGTATPSKKSQEKWILRSRGIASKHKRKGKGNGEGWSSWEGTGKRYESTSIPQSWCWR